MKRYLISITLICCLFSGFSQQRYSYEQGSVSFLSSQHVYVKFSNTDFIQVGDTLFKAVEATYVPALVVKNKSTTSCVSVLLNGAIRPVVGDVFFARKLVLKKEEKPEVPLPVQAPVVANPDPVSFTAPSKPERSDIEKNTKQDIRGRISAASYSSLSGVQRVHQMRYALNLQGEHIGNSKFSTDNYITFRHTLGEWAEVKSNFNRALIVYALGIRYDHDSTMSIALGRKINPNISSMGAIDGLQFEKKRGRFQGGVILGSRPDFEDYGINFNLFQAGAYMSYGVDTGRFVRQSTFAFVEQRNHFKTDRRFAYFQQSASLGPALNAFASFEVDLFSNINQTPQSTLSLTNTLLSLQLKVSRKLSLTGAYDNRKNVIYYESYKSFIDQLIEQETRQGLRIAANYRPFKTITWGINGSWRFQKNQENVSKNFNTYLNFNQIPVVNMSASISANLLQTDFLDSKMFGVRVSREIIPGILNADMYGRYLTYAYSYYENTSEQYVGGADLSFSLTRKLALHTYYEGTFDKNNTTLHRIHTKIIQRF